MMQHVHTLPYIFHNGERHSGEIPTSRGDVAHQQNAGLDGVQRLHGPCAVFPRVSALRMAIEPQRSLDGHVMDPTYPMALENG